jgi:hypothetical protein
LSQTDEVERAAADKVEVEHQQQQRDQELLEQEEVTGDFDLDLHRRLDLQRQVTSDFESNGGGGGGNASNATTPGGALQVESS